MVAPKELSTWALQKRSLNEVSKLRLGWDLLGACWEFVGCLLGVWFVESMEYNQLPKQLFQWALQKKLSKLRLGSDLLGACWEFAGCLLGYNLLNWWNTITFQSSYFNELSKWAHQKSSSNELSKLRPGWGPLGVCWSFQRPYVFLAHPAATFATS